MQTLKTGSNPNYINKVVDSSRVPWDCTPVHTFSEPQTGNITFTLCVPSDTNTCVSDIHLHSKDIFLSTWVTNDNDGNEFASSTHYQHACINFPTVDISMLLINVGRGWKHLVTAAIDNIIICNIRGCGKSIMVWYTSQGAVTQSWYDILRTVLHLIYCKEIIVRCTSQNIKSSGYSEKQN